MEKDIALKPSSSLKKQNQLHFLKQIYLLTVKYELNLCGVSNARISVVHWTKYIIFTPHENEFSQVSS